MTVVVDASAILAFLRGETGAAQVERALDGSTHCGAANWSEVAQKVIAVGADWDMARALLLSYGIHVESVDMADAEWAAQRWTEGEGLSLADRLCMALGERLDARVLTADSAWGTTGRIEQIR